MSVRGQTEKNSVRAYVFRSSPKNGRWFSTPQNLRGPNVKECRAGNNVRFSTQKFDNPGAVGGTQLNDTCGEQGSYASSFKHKRWFVIYEPAWVCFWILDTARAKATLNSEMMSSFALKNTFVPEFISARRRFVQPRISKPRPTSRERIRQIQSSPITLRRASVMPGSLPVFFGTIAGQS